jgi:endoglucanase Acf2
MDNEILVTDNELTPRPRSKTVISHQSSVITSLPTQIRTSDHRLLITLLAGLLLTFACGADEIKVGKASYLDELPNDGKKRRVITAKPLVSPQIKGAIPTNDWWSSLVWPTNTRHSQVMFPHPLGVKAHAAGLGLGYNPQPHVSHAFKDGKAFQRGVDYRYRYRESMIVGLKGMNSAATVLDDYSDWTVTGLWQDGDKALRATYGHGLPFVYFERTSDAPLHIMFKAAPINRHQQPVAPLVYTFADLTGKHNGKAGGFTLAVNAGKIAGVGSRARLVYDFDGDGKTDRTETFALFATDPLPGSWETYSSDKQRLDTNLTQGEMRDFNGGSVRLEFWKCFGKGGSSLKLADCSVQLPLANGKRSVADVANTDVAETGATDVKAGAAKVFHRDGAILGVSVNGTHYGIFAPTGTTWPAGDSFDQLTSDLAGKNYLSVAVLPDAAPATLAWFAKHAYARPTDTKVSYRYEPKNSRVVTTFTVATRPWEGDATDTVLALYRHQHLHLTETDRLTPHSYESARGQMRVIAGNEFETATPYLGVLPCLPNAPGAADRLNAELDRFYTELKQKANPFKHKDTYWNGKELGKISEAVFIADQLGKTEIRDALVKILERRIEDWADAKHELFFYYDKTWSTLVGYPDSYGSGEQLNDHHFHYSYFIRAAATIARFDPDWVNPENYGGFIDLLIRTCANYDRDDKRFCWMRNFDPYAGHSWAAGHAGFASGNNQESSSESMNFATSLILYGEATGNTAIRDLGIYWHATEAEAIRNYWFDLDGEVFPDGFGHSCVGMVWSDGGAYGTWWTANPEEIHGINHLPVNGGSLYLGRDPDYVLKNFANMQASNRNFHKAGFPGDPDTIDRWQDVLCEYLALADPGRALNLYETMADKPSEFGETKLHTRQWLTSLDYLGQVDFQITADHPLAAVFVNNGKKTYVIGNVSKSPIPVRFSDGVARQAAPGLSTFSPY